MFSFCLKLFGITLAITLVVRPAAAGVSRHWLGRVFPTSGVTLAGSIISREDAVFSGDQLTTSNGASALVRFSPASQADILENSSVRFDQDGAGHPRANVSSGRVVATSMGKNTVAIETAKYQVEPAGQTKAIYLVAVLPNLSTVIAARRGNVSITAIRSGKSYLLAEGRYAIIPPSAFDVPGQEQEKSQQAPAKPAGQAPPPTLPQEEKSQQAPPKPAGQAPPPPPPKAVKLAWHIGSLSHAGSVALVLAAAGGAGAAAAVVASSGGHAASPSVP